MMERFLLSLQGKRVVINLEDKMWWKETKDGDFFCEILLKSYGGQQHSPVLEKHHLEPLCS